MNSYEELNYSSSNVVNCPSSDFMPSEEEMTECLNRIDEIMENKNYAEMTREETENVRQEEIGKFKEIIKIGERNLSVSSLSRTYYRRNARNDYQ